MKNAHTLLSNTLWMDSQFALIDMLDTHVAIHDYSHFTTARKLLSNTSDVASIIKGHILYSKVAALQMLKQAVYQCSLMYLQETFWM